MSYPNFGKQHSGRGLKAFVIVVCFLLVVAIVASALVLWRTTNHYTELPEFDEEDGDELIITDDEEFNEDPYSDDSDSDDDEPDLSGGNLGVDWASFTGSGLSFEVTPLSSDVSAYASPLNTAAVQVTADFDLSKVNYEWYFEADDSFYYDGSWHDVMGDVFDDDYGNNIDSYLKIVDDTYDSCVVQFWDYFPATTYLYYHCWNSTGDVIGRVLVDCLYKEDIDSVYFYVGDLDPSFTVVCIEDDEKLWSEYGFDVPALYNGSKCDFTSQLSCDKFYGYYDGFGHYYNCILLDEIIYPNGFSDFCDLEFNTIISRGDEQIDFLYTYCYFEGYLQAFQSLSSTSGVISSLNFAPVFGEYYYLDSCLVSDFYVAQTLSYVMNNFGFAVLPHVSVMRVGSYFDDDLSCAYCYYPMTVLDLETTWTHYTSYESIGYDYFRDLCYFPLSQASLPYDYDSRSRSYSGFAVNMSDLVGSITGESYDFYDFEDLFSGFCSLSPFLDTCDDVFSEVTFPFPDDLFLEVQLHDPNSSYYVVYDFCLVADSIYDCFYY